MKKSVYYIVLLLTGVIFATGCVDNEVFLPKDTAPVFRFASAALAVDEVVLDEEGEAVGDGNTLTVSLTLHKNEALSGNINLEVFERTATPAIEGVDYTISAKSVSFSADEYIQTFTINTIYDPTFTGRKTFVVKMTSTDLNGARVGAFGASDSVVISINDVNHPLVSFVGPAKLFFESFYAGRAPSVDVELSTDPDDVTVLWMEPNLNGYNLPIKMTVKDTEDGEGFEVSIALPQDAGQNATGTQISTYVGMWDPEVGYYTEDDFNLVGTTSKNNIDVIFDEDSSFGILVKNPEGNVLGFFEAIVPGTLRISK